MATFVFDGAINFEPYWRPNLKILKLIAWRQKLKDMTKGKLFI